MDLGLADRSFLVTGGSSGIGLAAARLLLAEGAVVTICGRDLDRLAAAESELDSACLRTIGADVLVAEDAKAAVAAAVEHGQRLDGVAALAGRGRHGSLLDLQLREVGSEVSSKVSSFLNVVQPAVAHLMETSGAVVGVAAPTARRADAAMGAISMGRAALDSAVDSLALELAPSGIRVNAVGVGLIDTPRQQARHANSASTDDYQEWLWQHAKQRSVPLGRAGFAAEVAAGICWLLSPISSYTTGAVLDVTGGLRSR